MKRPNKKHKPTKLRRINNLFGVALVLAITVATYISSRNSQPLDLDSNLESLAKGDRRNPSSQDKLPSKYLESWLPGHTYSLLFDRGIKANIGQQVLTQLDLRGRLIVQVDDLGRTALLSVQLMGVRSNELSHDLAKHLINTLNDPRHQSLFSAQIDLVSKDKSTQVKMLPIQGGSKEENFFNSKVATIVKDIIGSFYFPRPSLPLGTPNLQVVGQDTIGVYSALLSQGGSPNQIKVSKLFYTKLDTNSSFPKIEKSEHLGTLNESGTLAELKGVDIANFDISTGNVRLEGNYRFLLHDYKRTTKVISFDIQNSRTVSLFETQRASQFSMARASFSDSEKSTFERWKEVEKELAGLLKSQRQAGSGRLETFAKLIELTKDDPNALEKLRQLALNLNQNSDAFRTVIGAINNIGTSESQSALISLYRNQKMSMDGKQTILNAFALGEYQLTSDSQAFLRFTYLNSTGPLQNSAGLVMSVASSRSPDPAAITLISDTWKKAETPQARTYAIQMMGNSANPSFTQQLISVVNSTEKSSYDLKADALYALRHDTTQAVATTIAQELLKNQSLEVREAALNVIRQSENPEIYEEHLMECVKGHATKTERAACASVILDNKLKMQNGFKLIEELAQSGSPAQEILATLKTQRERNGTKQ